jgi:hypothetical protein
MQRGGASKDTWVLTNGPVSDFSLLKPSVGVRDLVRAGANLSSRVVENLFWLGRYSERFDDSARMLRVALGRRGGRGRQDAGGHRGHGWPAMSGFCPSRTRTIRSRRAASTCCSKPSTTRTSRAAWPATSAA